MAKIIFRTEKLGTAGNVAGSSKHATRERETPNADPERNHLNRVIAGEADPAAEVSKRLEAYKAEGGKVLEKNVQAIELFWGASPDFFQTATPGQVEDFFQTGVKFARDKFGAKNFVSAIAHFDETTPHMTMYVTPIDRTPRKKGQALRLNAGKWLDGRKKMSALQDEAAEYVKHLGLERGVEGSKAKHTTVKEYYGTLAEAQKLAETNRVGAAVELANQKAKARERQTMAEYETRKEKVAEAQAWAQSRKIQPNTNVVGMVGHPFVWGKTIFYPVVNGNMDVWVPEIPTITNKVGHMVNVTCHDDRSLSVEKMNMTKDKTVADTTKKMGGLK